MQIKIFTGRSSEPVETAVNEWLAEHPAFSVTNVLQSESLIDGEWCKWSLTVTIVYIDSK